jgi:hypothetical protein
MLDLHVERIGRRRKKEDLKEDNKKKTERIQ